MVENILEAIRGEIVRLRADEGSVGPIEAIYVGDRGHGNAVLQTAGRNPLNLDVHSEFEGVG